MTKKLARWGQVNAIKEHAKFAKAWFEFCDENKLDANVSDALAVETFCCSYEDKGPTVPKAAYNSLRWLESNLGLRVDTQLESLKRATDHPAGHEPKSEEP